MDLLLLGFGFIALLVLCFMATGKTAELKKAAEKGDLAKVSSLLEEDKKRPIKFIDLNYAGRGDCTPLFYALNGRNSQIIELLLSNGASANFPKYSGNLIGGPTPLEEAFSLDDREIIQILFKYGAKITPKIKERYASSLLKFAIETNTRWILEELLSDEGFDVNTTDKDGKTPLLMAIGHNNKKITDLLLSKNASVNVKDFDGITPLHLTAVSGDTSLVRLLLSKGASVNVKDNYGLTPLHFSASDNKEITDILISKGADVNAKSKEKKTPLAYANEKGNREIADLLRQHGGTL